MVEIEQSAYASDASRSTMPNLFVIGAAKSGTTTLYEILRQHPHVYMSDEKEPAFFSRDSVYAKGGDWYLNRYFRGAQGFAVRGEATPAYLFAHQKTSPRIKEFLSGRSAKFIAVFRNPVDRAYSHYWYNRQTKLRFKENLSFEGALQSEESRIRNDPEFYTEGILRYAYFRAGLYADQVPTFVEVFGKVNCLFLLSEDLHLNAFAKTVRSIEQFLGLEERDLTYTRARASVRIRSKTLARLIRGSRPIRARIGPYLPRHIRTTLKEAVTLYNAVPFDYPNMDPRTRRMLLDKYESSVGRLEKILDRDLGHWSQ